MKEKKSVKSAAKAKVVDAAVAEHVAATDRAAAPAGTEAGPAETAVEAPGAVSGEAPRRRVTPAGIAAIACVGAVFAALVADNVCLHVEVRRQAEAVESHRRQIGALCEWVEHASVQGRWNDGAKSVSDFGRCVAEQFRAVGRKTVAAFHAVDDTLNP